MWGEGGGSRWEVGSLQLDKKSGAPGYTDLQSDAAGRWLNKQAAGGLAGTQVCHYQLVTCVGDS